MTKSQHAVPGNAVGHVNTVKIDGSMWSYVTLFTAQKCFFVLFYCVVFYLYVNVCICKQKKNYTFKLYL